MSNSPLDIGYILEVMAARTKLGEVAIQSEREFLTRLLKLGNPTSPVDPSASDPAAAGTNIRRLWNSIRGTMAMLLGAALLLPSFARQAALLRKLLRNADNDLLALAVASNRLTIGKSEDPVRLRLSALLQTLGSCPSAIDQEVGKAGVILLFDPLTISKFWKIRHASWRENVFVIDGAFACFLLVCQLLRHPVATGHGFGQVWSACRKDMAKRLFTDCGSLLRSVVYGLAAFVYRSVLRGAWRIEGVFLTSNSTLTEILRACLIQEPRCERVFELMHGIGSIPVEAFFAAVTLAGESFGASRKLIFVPQIPDMPLYGVLSRQRVEDPGFAVNGYLNQYFLDHPGTSDAQIAAQVKVLCGNVRADREPLVLTLFGNCSNDRKLYDSLSFQAECLLISMAGGLRGSLNKELVLVYVPHPAFGRVDIDHQVFRDNNVRIYRDSVFCWLVSDLSVSLMSSAIFEAAYFGVRAFTPLLPEDAFYTEDYLGMLCGPERNTAASLSESFAGFLRNSARLPQETLTTRAKRRLVMMRPSSETGNTDTRRVPESRPEVRMTSVFTSVETGAEYHEKRPSGRSAS